MIEERLKKVQLFLNFYFSNWGAAKGERWEGFVNERVPINTHSAERIVTDILSGEDDWLDWTALEGVA
jgi:hypothetical protein